MRTESIGDQEWDTSGRSNWAIPASLNTYLNGDYYNNLNSTAQNQIVAKDWSIRAVTYRNNNLTTQINEENATKWNGKVALVTVSEYIRSNSNKSNCDTFDKLLNVPTEQCTETTWMYNYGIGWWTLSTRKESMYYSFYVGSTLNVNFQTVKGYGYSVRPTLYLSSEVKITGGDGSQSNPYQISL